jgi:DNA-binding transcriptional MocR family regulator
VEPKLAAWAQRWMHQDLGIHAEINLTSGAIDALERLLCALLLPGDGVVVEDPCFLSSINMLRYAGFHACPVAVDGEGMLPDELELALRSGARAVILTPRAHNPTGCSFSEARAAAIREILAHYPQVLVIIDDHFALLSATPWHPLCPPPLSAGRWCAPCQKRSGRTCVWRLSPAIAPPRQRYVCGSTPAASGSAICCRALPLPA